MTLYFNESRYVVCVDSDEDGKTVYYRFEELSEAEAHLELVVASGGFSVAELYDLAAELDGEGETERLSLTSVYCDAAESLTPRQRELATSLYCDAEMSFMDAIEAARLLGED